MLEKRLIENYHWDTADAAFAGIAISIVFIILLVLVARGLVLFIFRRIDKRENPLATRLLRQAIMALIYAVGLACVCFQIPSLSAVAQSLLAGSGIAALVVGMASQASFANMAAGVFLLMSHPFRVGDEILIAVPGRPVQGEVMDITLRHTILRASDGHRVTVPNAAVNAAVIERLGQS